MGRTPIRTSYALGRVAGVGAMLADQVPVTQRGTTAGAFGLCLPVGVVAGTYLVQLVSPRSLPCSWFRARSAAR